MKKYIRLTKSDNEGWMRSQGPQKYHIQPKYKPTYSTTSKEEEQIFSLSQKKKKKRIK